MTLVGKILVFINLLFSLVVGSLIVVAFVARTNWYDGYKKLEDRYKVVAAEAETWRYGAEQERNAYRDNLKNKDAEIQRLVGEVAAQKQMVSRANDATETEKQKVVKAEATVSAMKIEVEKREEEVKNLAGQLTKVNDNLTATVKEKNVLRDQAVASKIAAEALRDRNGELEKQVQDMAKDVARARTPSTTGTVSTFATKNPPLENIEGRIKDVDARNNLMTLNIGSDAGLTEGHTMEVFRLNPAKYLGTLRIIKVTPHEAVAKPLSRTLGIIQKEDTVSSKILGS